MATLNYKCPGCGGPLKWNAAKEKYSCEYCLSEFTQEELDKAQTLSEKTETLSGEEAKASGIGEEAGKDGTVKVYRCPSCGATLATEETTAASSCYYCHAPVVLADRLEGDFKPDKVIPFTIDKKRALEIFRDWIKKHRYVPSLFYSEDQISLFSGVYFPYWVYSADVKGHLKATAEKDRIWESGNEKYTETSVYRIDRDGTMPVRNVSRIALGKASKVLCEGTAPFEYEKMKPFSAGYLSGFMAETRDIEQKEVEEEIREEVREFAESSLSGEVQSGYTRMKVESLDATATNEKWEYCLMPVWTLTYRGKDGKVYYFSINGSTGKPIGELPVDNRKLLFLFLKIFIPVFLFVMILLFILS